MATTPLTIEWRHLELGGNTCIRCADTGMALDEVVASLAAECRGQGIDIRYLETRLGIDDIDQSNSILLNGRPIEDILPTATVGVNLCESCCELTGQPTNCRTVTFANSTYEALPAALIREAVCRVADCCAV